MNQRHLAVISGEVLLLAFAVAEIYGLAVLLAAVGP